MKKIILPLCSALVLGSVSAQDEPQHITSEAEINTLQNNSTYQQALSDMAEICTKLNEMHSILVAVNTAEMATSAAAELKTLQNRIDELNDALNQENESTLQQALITHWDANYATVSEELGKKLEIEAARLEKLEYYEQKELEEFLSPLLLNAAITAYEKDQTLPEGTDTEALQRVLLYLELMSENMADHVALLEGINNTDTANAAAQKASTLLTRQLNLWENFNYVSSLPNAATNRALEIHLSYFESAIDEQISKIQELIEKLNEHQYYESESLQKALASWISEQGTQAAANNPELENAARLLEVVNRCLESSLTTCRKMVDEASTSENTPQLQRQMAEFETLFRQMETWSEETLALIGEQYQESWTKKNTLNILIGAEMTRLNSVDFYNNAALQILLQSYSSDEAEEETNEESAPETVQEEAPAETSTQTQETTFTEEEIEAYLNQN